MLVAFDLDGTLIDARDIHYRCFNSALSLADVQPISYDEHLRRFDGLPTSKKMEMLAVEGRLERSAFQSVEAEKRRLTAREIVPRGPDARITSMLDSLKSDGHKVAVVSNARWETVNQVVASLLISPDAVISNEDVVAPKPSPEGYLRAMVQCGVGPTETLVLEDAPAGKAAARASGARLVPVFDPADLTAAELDRYIAGGTSFDVVMPMAGEGRRFKEAGYVLPKPLIDVGGRPMIAVATETLGMPEARHIYLAGSSHLRDWATEPILRSLAAAVEVHAVGRLTDGAARTVMLARELIDHDRPVVVANSDQWIGWDADAGLHTMVCKRWDAAALYFEAPDMDRKWSYAELDGDMVTRTAEKDPISTHALCGVFMYRRGRDLIRSIDSMMERGQKVNDEWYVAPSLNFLGGRIGAIRAEMRGLGTPTDLMAFLSSMR